jgi:hypothetical protein
MARVRRTKFDDLREQAWRGVCDWAKAVASEPLPTPLHVLARLQKIQCVRFEPLLSTAGLTKHDNGYAIIVNTEAPGVTQNAGAVLPADNAWDDLAPPLRFTLAHEISHLFFLDAIGVVEKRHFVRNHAQLEKACNEMSRVLLIPQQRLMSEIKNADHLFDSSHLKRLTTMFRVSPEVLVRRLNLTDMQDAFGNVDGLIAFVRGESKGFRIVASHIRGPQAHARFRVSPRLSGQNHPIVSKRPGNPDRCMLKELQFGSDLDTSLETCDQYQEHLRVPGASNSELPCEFNACLTSLRPRAFLISIRVSGPPRDRHQMGKNQSLTFDNLAKT